MKNIIYCTILLMAASLFHACSFDNYDAPKSKLTGAVTYNGDAIGVRHGDVKFDLYQDSYELNNTIEVFVAADGTFSALLFDGDYRMVSRNGSGPWLDGSDEVTFTVKGNTAIEYKVTPYCTVSDTDISLAGNALAGSCTLTPVGAGVTLQSITLYVGKNHFVDDRSYNNLLAEVATPATGLNALTMDISSIASKYQSLYARIGVKIQGVEKPVFSETVKVK